MTTSPTIVEVTLQALEQGRERYVDYNEPDRLQRRQIQAWQWEWQPEKSVVPAIGDGDKKDDSKDQDESKDADDSSIRNNHKSSFTPTHRLAGTLIWKGDYLHLHLATRCEWKGTAQEGAMDFSCAVTRAEFTTAPVSTEKVHQKMIQRLGADDYIAKLLRGPQSLVEATVVLDRAGSLEERVYCDEGTAKAIQRGLFSSADGTIDVFDWVLSLPLLPCAAHKESGVSVTTPLADRVRLRCLEEATYDACEQEEEEELVENLHISKKTKSS
jgi:hypothetical protein